MIFKIPKSTVKQFYCGFLYFMRISIVIYLLLACNMVYSQDVIWRDSLNFDFGEIKQGQPVEHIFYFKNTLDEPIEIETVRTDCGCTESEWSTDPIATNLEGTIKVRFDAYNRGYFKKKLKVYFRKLKKSHTLKITGYVF